MSYQPSSRPSTGTSSSRRLAGLLVGLVAEVLLLSALALAAWGPNENEYWPALSFGDGLGSVLVVGGIGSVFVVSAATFIAATRQWWGVALATVLMAMAGFIGFLGFIVISFSRCETCDDA